MRFLRTAVEGAVEVGGHRLADDLHGLARQAVSFDKRLTGQAAVLPHLRRVERRHRGQRGVPSTSVGQAVEIVGQAMTTDFDSTFDGSAKNLIGYDMNVQAAQEGLRPVRSRAHHDFQVIELHDCFSANELLLYEALGLCAEGEAPEADRQQRHHIRRALGRQPVRRPHLQGPPARRDGPGAVRRADLATAPAHADKRQVADVTAALRREHRPRGRTAVV